MSTPSPEARPRAKRAKAAPLPLPVPRSEPAIRSASRSSSLALFEHLLLPYQVEWLLDRRPLKKWVKSRRIGGTWTQSLEDVLDCVDTPGLKVWFSSADMTAAVEYLDYARMWVDVSNLIVQTFVIDERELITGDEDLDVLEIADLDEGKATVLVFHNGSRINVLSSKPSAFRSKGGKVVLDEFAHHQSDRELWTAAQPVAGAWGYPIRILSTLKGKSNVFYRLGNSEFAQPDEDAEAARPDEGWSVHTVTIRKAVDDGMYDRVKGRPTTHEEREAYIRGLEAQCIDKAQFLEEFMCIPQDEAHALLTYEMIAAASRTDLLGLDKVTGPLYVGMDIARRRDLSVIYAVEPVGRDLVTRVRIEMAKTKFSVQKSVLWDLLRHPRLVRASIDATGIGAQLAEEAQDAFGVYRVEAVTFTASIKDALATRLVQEFQDGTLLVEPDRRQTEGLHAVNKIVTATNSVRYDAVRDEQNGHGDHFWALALAAAAARTGDTGEAGVLSRPGLSSVASGMSSWGTSSSLDSWASMR